MASVLVLNATYEPLNVVSLRRAVVLLLKEKAEILEATEKRIRAERLSLPVPIVIRLVYYVRVPSRVNVPCTRRTVMIRDNYTCQYCGKTPPRSELTIDHIIPKVRGGKTTWDNVVCACQRCNLHKGSRTPHDANMTLLSTPTRPRFLAMVLISQVSSRQAWSKYLPEHT